jgi:hypothetical protein
MDVIGITRFQASKIKAGQLHLRLPHQGPRSRGPLACVHCSQPRRQARVRGGYLHGECAHGRLLQEWWVLRRHEDVQRNADAGHRFLEHGYGRDGVAWRGGRREEVLR